MITTVSIDDDVLLSAKAIAGQQGRSLGEVISELARRSLKRPACQAKRNGIPLLTSRPDSLPVTMNLVNTLRDEVPGHTFST